MDRKVARKKAMEVIRVGIAEHAVSTNGVLLRTTGLGSCVGIALRDREYTVSGLVHVMLPSSEEIRDDNRAKFADTGVELLLEEMDDRGAGVERLEAKIAGGSNMFGFTSPLGSMGERNVAAVCSKLDELDIPIVGQDVGGDYGRTLEFRPLTGDLIVKTARNEVKRI